MFCTFPSLYQQQELKNLHKWKQSQLYQEEEKTWNCLSKNLRYTFNKDHLLYGS